jgi:hypothetical protein
MVPTPKVPVATSGTTSLSAYWQTPTKDCIYVLAVVDTKLSQRTATPVS